MVWNRKVLICLLTIAALTVAIGATAETLDEWLQANELGAYSTETQDWDAIFPSVIRMAGAGLIDNSRIITSRFPLDQAVDAIAKSTARADGKIIVHP